jgi:hypothetical protein
MARLRLRSATSKDVFARPGGRALACRFRYREPLTLPSLRTKCENALIQTEYPFCTLG